eukprot:6462902-Amphidinium_carterae.3
MSLSRGVRQRVGKRHALQLRSNEVIEGLNWLAGRSSSKTEGAGGAESAEATARSLLGNGLQYDAGTCSVASLNSAHLSIPKAGSVSIDLCSRLPSESSCFLQRPEELMLLNSEDWGRLVECNLVELIPAREVICRVGVFTVFKKDGRQRLIIDCRATNQMFRPPACGTEYFGFGGGADFAGGYNLPIGWWSWAFYFGQQAHVAEVCRALDLGPGDLLSDVRPAPDLVDGALLVLPYCDNLIVGSTCKESADRAREDVASLCRRAGYIVHEEENASLCVRSLGFEINRDTGLLTVGEKRHMKVEALIRFLLKFPVVNGRQLERALGHITFVFLIRRDLLSIFGACYSFIRTHYQFRRRLWGSCLQELKKQRLACCLWQRRTCEGLCRLGPT